MAAALASSPVTVSLDAYLNGRIPEPDVEYVDGVLKEKPLVQKTHGRLQAILCAWFESHAEPWGQVASVEVRTRVSAFRVRLPDVLVDRIGPGPETIVEPPTIVIEIVSPSESFTELHEKLLDYQQMGVLNIWVIDPQLRRGWIFDPAGLLSAERFAVRDSPVYLDLSETFARYDRFR